MMMLILATQVLIPVGLLLLLFIVAFKLLK